MSKHQITSFFSSILKDKRIPSSSLQTHLLHLEQTQHDFESLSTSIPSLNNYFTSLIPYFQHLNPNLSSQFISLYILIHIHFYNFPLPSQRFLLQNELKSLLLSITSEIESLLKQYQYELIPQSIHEYNIVISIELLLELITTMFIRYFPNDNIYNDSFTANQIENDVKKLFIINCSLPWLYDIITAIYYIYSISRCKSFLTLQNKCDGLIKSSAIKTKCVIKNFSILNGITLLIRKYIINKQTLLNNPLMNWKSNYCDSKLFDKIYMNDLDIISTKLIEIINENVLVSYKTFEKDLKSNINLCINSFSKLLLFISTIYDNMLYIKFKYDNFKIDFHSYFMWFYEYSNFLCDELNKKTFHYINELFSFFKQNKTTIQHQRTTFSLSTQIDYTIIEHFHTILKKFLVLHMIASFNSDSFCDCFIKNEWMKHIVDTYTLISFFKSCYSVYIETEMKKNTMVKVSYSSIIKQMFELISNELTKYEVIFPLRLFIFKEMLIQNHMILVYHFIKCFQEEFPDIVCKCDPNIQSSIIDNLNEISKSQNPYNFVLALLILRNIQPDNNDNYKIRFYIHGSFPLDYYDINLLKKTFFDKTNINNGYMEIDSGNKENINVNIIYNEQNGNFNIRNSNRQTNRPTIHKKSSLVSSFQDSYQNKNEILSNNNNLIELEQYDISSIVNSIDVSFIQEMKDVFVNYENVYDKHIISYMANGIPLVVFQEPYGFRQCKLKDCSLLELLQERIGSKVYIENIFQCFLIGDLTGNNKDNLELTLKYYDVEGEMDYFGFVEQLKKVIV